MRGIVVYHSQTGNTEKIAHAIHAGMKQVINECEIGTLKEMNPQELVGYDLIGLGSPWENGYIESFNGKLMDELLNREIFMTLEEAKVLIEQWRREYNQAHPYSSLGYQPPAPEAILSEITT